MEGSRGDTGSLGDFERGEFLSNGSFCEVIKCKDRSTGKVYAMKVVVKKQSEVDQACVMELHCLQRLADSPAVISCFWHFDSSAEWVGVLEFCEGGELWAYIRGCGCCAQGESAWYASQMVDVVAVVHAAGIIHRDIKCENFLLTKEHRVKLIDFGTARDTTSPDVKPMLLGPQYQHHVGTPNFMSPEAVHGKANDQRSDLWSLGCAICQLMIGAPPFNAATPFLVLQKAQAGNIWLPANGISMEERDLIQQLTHKDPDARLGAAGGRTRRVLEHVFFRSMPPLAAAVTPIYRALRSIGRAAIGESDAAVAAEDAAKEEGDDHFLSFGRPTAPPAPEPGAETAKLLEELPTILDNADAGPGGKALLNAVREAAACAAAAAAPREFCRMLSSVAEIAALPPFAQAQLQRFSEMVDQRWAEAHEQVSFGGDSESEEASEGDALEDADAGEGNADSGKSPKQERSGAIGKANDGSTSRGHSSDSRPPPRKCCPF